MWNKTRNTSEKMDCGAKDPDCQKEDYSYIIGSLRRYAIERDLGKKYHH